jgi:GT2 family glycosyltransferase
MLVEAVQSALAQTYADVEVVIVDDGSTDSTSEVALALAAAHPGNVRVERQACRGPGAARNTGLSRATGEFVQYLDSDDLLEPRKLELQVRALRDHPDAGVAYGLTRRVDLDTGATADWARTAAPIEAIFPSFLDKRGWDTNSPLWRRSVCDAIGPWSELRCMEDWVHDLRAGLLGVRPVQVEAHVATVRDHGQARSSGTHSGYTRAMALDTFRAHREVWQRMQAAGMTDWSYLQPLSSKMFWLARLCAGLALHAEADDALAMSREMAAAHSVPLKQSIFHATRALLGWSVTESLAAAARTLLRRDGVQSRG